eukprot:2286821-Rhodomonas_salina.1
MRKKFKETNLKLTKNEKTPKEQLPLVDTPGFLVIDTSGSCSVPSELTIQMGHHLLGTFSQQNAGAFVATVETGAPFTETQDNLDNLIMIQHEIKSFRQLPPAPVNFDIVGTLMCLAHITCGVSASIIATIVCLLGVVGHYLALPSVSESLWSLVGFLLYITSVVGLSILLWVITVLLLDCYVQHPCFCLVYKLKWRKSVQLAQLRANIMMWQAIQQHNFVSALMATAQVSPHIMMALASTMKKCLWTLDAQTPLSTLGSILFPKGEHLTKRGVPDHIQGVPSLETEWVHCITPVCVFGTVSQANRPWPGPPSLPFWWLLQPPLPVCGLQRVSGHVPSWIFTIFIGFTLKLSSDLSRSTTAMQLLLHTRSDYHDNAFTGAEQQGFLLTFL